MSQHYQVLARKYRPHTFSEMVGQTHTVKTLINALDADSLHHAFLFTGTRGVGKTPLPASLLNPSIVKRVLAPNPVENALLVLKLTKVNRLT